LWHVYRVSNHGVDLTVYLRSLGAGEPLRRDAGLASRVLPLVRPECPVDTAAGAVVRPASAEEWGTDRALFSAALERFAVLRDAMPKRSRAWHSFEHLRTEVQRAYVFLAEHGPANIVVVDYPGLGEREDGDREVYVPLPVRERVSE